MSTEQLSERVVERVGPSGPIREHALVRGIEHQASLEQALARGETPDPQLLRDYRQLLFQDVIRERPVFSLAWPASWYIPGDADYRQYWFTPPPAANRYDYGWAHSQLYPTSTAQSGSPSTGHVYAYTALAPSDTHDSGFAGVGALFQPSATLSYADVSVDADVVAHSRIWTLLARPTHNLVTVHIRCTAFVCVWEIDPVTRAWELMRPYGSQTLVNRFDTGQSGTPIQTVNGHYSGNALSTRVQVQAGHSYAIGFQAQVDIEADARDANNQPYQRGGGDDWKLWADMSCAVSQITIGTKVLIP